MDYDILLVPPHNLRSNSTAQQRTPAAYHILRYLFSRSANVLVKGSNILLAERQEKATVRASEQETS